MSKDPSTSNRPADLPLISFVAPVFMEETGVAEFHRRCAKVADELAPRYRVEMVLVNDGSTDGTLAALRRIQAADPRVAVLDLSRNFGHQAALCAGIEHARGDAVVTLDSDLQDPPELIPTLIDQWEAGCEVVLAQRRTRAGEGLWKLAAAHVYYRLLRALSDYPVPVDVGDFRLIDRRVADVLSTMTERARYLRGLVAWVGFRQVLVPYDRDPRYTGVAKYTSWKLFRLAADGLWSFSEKPLLLVSYVGLAITFVAAVMFFYVVVAKLISPGSAVSGWASLMCALMLMSGLQLVSLGVIGQYLARVYVESKARPMYVVRESRPSGLARGGRALDTPATRHDAVPPIPVEPAEHALGAGAYHD